ncbi:MAG: hypothetical protein H6779_00490 [Candidatus Nomurabacteria bacterium]|nr:hypothetical protein [Candidatus Nomurabacteria bacterium]USN87908.1 MAG: hypothetical protein H6779_00490 [Candidatus Nomurabacteria bacterium]
MDQAQQSTGQQTGQTPIVKKDGDQDQTQIETSGRGEDSTGSVRSKKLQ